VCQKLVRSARDSSDQASRRGGRQQQKAAMRRRPAEARIETSVSGRAGWWTSRLADLSCTTPIARRCPPAVQSPMHQRPLEHPPQHAPRMRPIAIGSRFLSRWSRVGGHRIQPDSDSTSADHRETSEHRQNHVRSIAAVRAVPPLSARRKRQVRGRSARWLHGGWPSRSRIRTRADHQHRKGLRVGAIRR